MRIFIFILILFVSLLVGVFGFSQIIGCIKYYQNKSYIFTIMLWTVILSLGFLAVYSWLNSYLKAIIIGYIISFILSLSVKPD
jgi:hypothetical protein